jgi:hypothetical protein
MSERVKQKGNTVEAGDLVGGDKVGGDKIAGDKVILAAKKTRLAILFEKLNKEFNADNKVDHIIHDLERYISERDTIGLEQKLINGEMGHLYERASWLKQEYFKKLTRFQFFEPAQEIHALILGIILEKFHNIIYPMIRNNNSEAEVLLAISNQIIAPILNMVEQDGCDDVMGITSTEIDGMIYFLTGICHIKWNK